MFKLLLVCSLTFLSTNSFATEQQTEGRIAKAVERELKKTELTKKVVKVKRSKTVGSVLKQYKFDRLIAAAILGFGSKYVLMKTQLLDENTVNYFGAASAMGIAIPSGSFSSSAFWGLLFGIFHSTPIGLAVGAGNIVGSVAGETIDTYFYDEENDQRALKIEISMSDKVEPIK